MRAPYRYIITTVRCVATFQELCHKPIMFGGDKPKAAAIMQGNLCTLIKAKYKTNIAEVKG